MAGTKCIIEWSMCGIFVLTTILVNFWIGMFVVYPAIWLISHKLKVQKRVDKNNNDFEWIDKRDEYVNVL